MEKPMKTEQEQVEFFDICLQKFREAVAVLGDRNFYYDVAGTIVCISFAGEAMIHLFTPALAHIEISGAMTADVIFKVWDSDSSGVKMVEPPCKWSDFTDRGDITGFESKRIKTAFHWGELSLAVMDLQRNTGVFWVQSPEKLPFWTQSAPLRTLFHWWLEKNNKQLLHAAAIATESGAVLITGKGGVGKSTTALTCLEQGMLYLSDDYVVAQLEPEPAVFCLYSSAKVKKDETEFYPTLDKCLTPYVRNKEGKRMILLYPEFKNRIVNKMPLLAILSPQIANKPESKILSVPYWNVQAAMSFTTLSHLPYAGRHTHDFICALCNKLPSFKLLLGDQREKIPALILTLMASISQNQLETIDTSEVVELKPLISVIVPVFNGEKFIREAINNILSQNYPALEIIVVNDGSTDNSEEIIKTLPVELRYVLKENSGPASARNRGIAEASGEYLAFLDVDDLWPENNLHRLVDEIQSESGLMVVHGYGQLLKKNESTGNWDFMGNPKESFPGYIGAGLYRREIFKIVGLFDTNLNFGEDADWFNRAYEMNIPLKKLEEVTLYVRRHGANMTEGRTLVELNVLHVFKKSLDRLRRQNPEMIEALDPKRVTVIIPCYNAAKYLDEAVMSVLKQECKPLEIILVDDGSTDNSVEVAQKYENKIRIIKQEHRGAAAARNLGIRYSRGSFLAFLDADDVWEPQHLFHLLKAFVDNPGMEMILGHVEQFVSPEIAGAEHQLLLNEGNRIIAGGHPGAMLVRKDVFAKVGMLNENLELGEFVDWFSRANDMNVKQKIIDDIIYKRRIHTSNQGLLKKEYLKDYVKVIKSSLDRKKGNK